MMAIKALVLLFVVAFAAASPIPAEEKSTTAVKSTETPVQPIVPAAAWAAGYYGPGWNAYAAYPGYAAGYPAAYRSGLYPGYTGAYPYTAGITGYPAGYAGYPGYTGYPYAAGYVPAHI